MLFNLLSFVQVAKGVKPGRRRLWGLLSAQSAVVRKYASEGHESCFSAAADAACIGSQACCSANQGSSACCHIWQRHLTCAQEYDHLQLCHLVTLRRSPGSWIHPDWQPIEPAAPAHLPACCSGVRYNSTSHHPQLLCLLSLLVHSSWMRSKGRLHFSGCQLQRRGSHIAQQMLAHGYCCCTTCTPHLQLQCLELGSSPAQADIG